MSFWSALVAIVAIIAFAALRKERYRAGLGDEREDRMATSRQLSPGRTAELERELADLRERVAVLERIATDGRSSRAIAAEIESLRDHREGA